MPMSRFGITKLQSPAPAGFFFIGETLWDNLGS